MAGRPRYQITSQDYAAARRYIENAMAREELSSVDGYMRFRQATTPALLQAWCDSFVPAPVMKKLKNAVIAARKRARDYGTTGDKVSVDLDCHAHMRLASLSDELGKTLSDTVLLLEESYWASVDAGIIKRVPEGEAE